jgi:hypothetical protein
MTTVAELLPGDVVHIDTASATFIAETQHPLWPHLRLVIWRMADGGWSHDALDIRQDVGQAVPADLFARKAALTHALLGAQR